MEKKKGSDHFRDILNPYGEKSNYGKIGRRRRLSKLNVFFSIIQSVTINYNDGYNLMIISFWKWLWINLDQFGFIFAPSGTTLMTNPIPLEMYQAPPRNHGISYGIYRYLGSYELCFKCLAWRHQTRKSLRCCLRIAYARTSFTYARYSTLRRPYADNF